MVHLGEVRPQGCLPSDACLECVHETLDSVLSTTVKPVMMVHTYSPHTQEVKAEGSK